MALPYSLENRFQETAVLIECGLIVTGHRSCYGHRGGGRNNFKAADKDTHDLFWCWIDCERQNVVDEAAGHDLDQAATFLEPRVFPSFNHGMGLVSI